MGDLGPFAILAIAWWLLSLFADGRRKQQRRGSRPPRPAPPRSVPPGERPSLGDPSQREGSRLEEILREMERALDPSTQVPDPVSQGGWDVGEADVEEVESLDDYEPEVVSREDLSNFERPEREVVVLGGDQEELQRRRTQYAEVRSKALTRADHDRFDAEIRKPQKVAIVDPGEPASARVLRLRQAIIWREVLGPPVAMRGEERF
jgi:hypothetical protein